MVTYCEFCMHDINYNNININIRYALGVIRLLGPDLGLHVAAALPVASQPSILIFTCRSLNNRKSILCASITMSGSTIQRKQRRNAVHRFHRYIVIAALKLFVLAIFGIKLMILLFFVISTSLDIGKISSLHPILLQVSSSLCHNLLEPSEMTVVYSPSS